MVAKVFKGQNVSASVPDRIAFSDLTSEVTQCHFISLLFEIVVSNFMRKDYRAYLWMEESVTVLF